MHAPFQLENLKVRSNMREMGMGGEGGLKLSLKRE